MFDVDDRLLQLLLTNLLKNAVVAIGDDLEEIRISGSSDSYENEVPTVSDMGAEILSEAIDRFYTILYYQERGRYWIEPHSADLASAKRYDHAMLKWEVEEFCVFFK